MTPVLLGWSDAGAPVPAPLLAERIGPVQVISLPDGSAPCTRSRLRAMLACAAAAPAFLPAAKRAAHRPEAVRRWTEVHAGAVATRLAYLRHQTQITLSVATGSLPTGSASDGGPSGACAGNRPDHEDRPASGRAWLARRQAAVSARAAAGRAAEQTLADLVRSVPCRDRRIHRNDRSVQLDLLVPSRSARTAMSALADAAKGLPEAVTRDLALSGPWPAFGFTGDLQ